MLNFNTSKEPLPLKTTTGRLFTINREYLQDLVTELEDFLKDEDFMNSRTFSKKVMFTHEIKANNTVEGINDSVSLIEKVIENAKTVSDAGLRNRIINLYNGYKYILNGYEINDKTVADLYQILSKDLLDPRDEIRMGPKYRTAPVYILINGRLDGVMDYGIDAKDIEEYMNVFFEYVNKDNDFSSATDYFIKSQIMHFYFVYIHPYFDMNGRTSRTIAMWYLLNHEIYPYIIFNRGINFDVSYDKVIRECKNWYELTKFIKYMLITVKKELEKEYVMHYLRVASGCKWQTVDYQTIEYILAMKGDITVLDYARMYNRFNDKKRTKEIFATLEPLIQDGTIKVVRETKKMMFGDEHNLVLGINKEQLRDVNLEKVKRLVL